MFCLHFFPVSRQATTLWANCRVVIQDFEQPDKIKLQLSNQAVASAWMGIFFFLTIFERQEFPDFSNFPEIEKKSFLAKFWMWKMKVRSWSKVWLQGFSTVLLEANVELCKPIWLLQMLYFSWVYNNKLGTFCVEQQKCCAIQAFKPLTLPYYLSN